MFHVYISIIILFHLSPISNFIHIMQGIWENIHSGWKLGNGYAYKDIICTSIYPPKLYIFDVVAIPFINWTFKTIKKSVYLQFVPLIWQYHHAMPVYIYQPFACHKTGRQSITTKKGICYFSNTNIRFFIFFGWLIFPSFFLFFLFSTSNSWIINTLSKIEKFSSFPIFSIHFLFFYEIIDGWQLFICIGIERGCGQAPWKKPFQLMGLGSRVLRVGQQRLIEARGRKQRMPFNSFHSSAKDDEKSWWTQDFSLERGKLIRREQNFLK